LVDEFTVSARKNPMASAVILLIDILDVIETVNPGAEEIFTSIVWWVRAWTLPVTI